jgi:hypothetical protein
MVAAMGVWLNMIVEMASANAFLFMEDSFFVKI